MAYIDRDTLLEFVKQNTPHINGETTLQCVENAIKEAPTADVVEVKHSQWVANHTEWVSKGNEYISKSTIVPYNEDLDSCEHSSPFCLNCGTDAIYNGAGDFEITKYCHNCGAKMDLVGDE